MPRADATVDARRRAAKTYGDGTMGRTHDGGERHSWEGSLAPRDRLPAILP